MKLGHTDPEMVAAPLAPWEVSVIEVFIGAVGLVGLPRSIGQIYGLLFCAPQPLSLDDLVDRLGISRGSASQGLKLLRQLGAVQTQQVAGSRKDHYRPELSIRRLVGGFVRDQIAVHLQAGAERLDGIALQIEAEPDVASRAHAVQRIGTLRTWQQRMQALLPIIVAALGGTGLLKAARDGRPQIV